MAALQSYYSYEHNTVRVWTAARPGAGAAHWTERPYLRCDALNLVAAPDIDECLLTYWTGEFIAREPDDFGNAPVLAPTWFDALELNRQFVKVEVLDNNAIDPATGERTVLLTWYGVIEVDERSEAQKPDESIHRTGRQALTAFGLLRLLETTYIRSSEVKGTTLDTQQIGRGLPFNFDSRGAFSRRGNRTRLKIDGLVYVFNFLPEADDDPDLEDNFWTADDAVQYLLKHHAPQDSGNDELCTWVAEPLEGAKLPLEFYDITVETDRRSVKEVLDELIDRRRMVGYWVYGRETGNPGSETFEAVLKVFTFTAEAIALDDGEIPANPELENLIAGAATIVGDVKVRQVATSQFDEIIVEGGYITSTLTLGVGENLADVVELVKGWTDDQEDDYRDGAGADEIENTIARSRDELRDVFARYLADSEWPRSVAAGDVRGPVEEFFVTLFPSQIPFPVEDADVHDLFLKSGDPDEDAAVEGPWSFHARRFLDLTPLKDVETNEYRRPFTFFGEGPAGAPSGMWCLAENVSAADADRRFNCSTRLLQDRLGFHCEVNQPGGQHLIAADHWAGAAATPEELNPDDVGGLHYENLRITGTVEWDDKVEVTKSLGAPTGHKRVLVIPVPDARLDFVLPGTATDISASGGLVESSGAVLHDDRGRLKAIAEAAAVWYGAPRQALAISFRELHPTLTIGTLLQRLWGVSDEPINTPVTGIRLDFRAGVTSIETSYVEIDFAGIVGSSA